MSIKEFEQKLKEIGGEVFPWEYAYKELDGNWVIDHYERIAVRYPCFRTKYENGFGASIVRHPGSYGYEHGEWELAVIKWFRGDEWHLCYHTPIGDDVIGNLTEEAVIDICKSIAGLPKDTCFEWFNEEEQS